MAASVFVAVLIVLGLLAFLDAVRHVALGWSTYVRADRSYTKVRPSSSRPRALEVLELPFPDASREEAERWRRNVAWFVADVLLFAVLIGAAMLVQS
jgi:hypothetical protein